MVRFYNVPKNAKYFTMGLDDIGLGDFVVITFFDENKKKILEVKGGN